MERKSAKSCRRCAPSSRSAARADAGNAAKLEDETLRGRAKNGRHRSGGGKLSADESKALRQKLASDRQELRQHVARKLGKGQGETDNQASADWRKDQRESKA